MGANLDSQTFKACNQSELHTAFDRLVDESRIHDGIDAYSGTFATKTDGLQIHDTFFHSEKAADEWMEDRLDKWGPAVAVKIKKPSARTAKKLKTLGDKIREIGSAHSTLAMNQQDRRIYTDAIARAKETKNKTKSCKNCESQIARAHIHTADCPVCDSKDFLLTQADHGKLQSSAKKRAREQEKVAALQAQIDQAMQADEGTDYYWFVAALCPS